MRGILIVASLLLAVLAYAGTSTISQRKAPVSVARITIASDADAERLRIWINQSNVDIVSMGFSGDKLLVVYRQ